MGKRRFRRRKSALFLGCGLAAAVAFGGWLGLAGPADSAQAAASSGFALADPDTVHANDGRYVTYGTTVGSGGKRCGKTGKLYVPELVSGSGNTVGTPTCASGDALPSGPGAWATAHSAVWAPGVAKFNGKYFMYYAASKKGTGEKCIGLATSTSARGPFKNAGEFACPSNGRWNLDPDPFVSGGHLYVTYRDDNVDTGAETGISTVRTDANGHGVWSTRRTMLLSTDITWDTKKTSGGTHVVENPSMFKAADKHWYLTYSGNNWNSARYATGIADCGTSPLPGSRCKPLRNGAARPFFGYTGSAGLGPYRGLPGNHQGPGGMDVFQAADGSYRAVWAWWNGKTRYPEYGALKRNSGGFYVS